ncbi:nickel/cobalt ABC transporter permease [Anaerotignum sp. MB30-C6]|uniref:nickel/cobalt ABC transporter permease n=1 Tax=Anaerotignum sp. MB30-C6 TaxID=3070814 RepID=UPI0027DB0FFA|nr:nickel/cobalt ABC transporter permease [Anaerotignum sp. MB30-C6]WMI80776.1 ABC transporter permease subunit [Anaerotignum sp. MB30-C6]
MKILKKLKKDPVVIGFTMIILVVILLGCFAPLIAPNDPNEMSITLKYGAISFQYPFGNDYLGRCIFSRILYGIRPSVLMVISAMMLTVSIGTLVGLVAGYFKGKVDEILMRICDIMLSFPPDAMVLASVGIFGVGLRNILLTIVFLRWPWYARVFRTAVMKYTDKNFIQFAKASGTNDMRIIFRHILPSVLPDITVVASNNICTLILMISGFSFLGLGVQAPTAEWGVMLNEAKRVMLSHPEQLIAPATAIILVCVSFAFLGDALRDAMDSKHMNYNLQRKGFKVLRNTLRNVVRKKEGVA